MNPARKTPSEKSLRILESLKKSVSETLERKRKLGHYAVIWDGKKPVQRGDDAPTPRLKIHIEKNYDLRG